jgi:type IV pilus assembly protein PilX
MVMSIKNHSKHTFKNGLVLAAVKTQKGLVLFFALIALVAMSLAAAALIRSVDTSVLVAGNLAFKQSSTISADSGLISAMAWVKANGAALNATSAANGYYSTSTALALTAATNATWPNGGAWTDATSRLATGSGLTAGTDTAGNNVRYVVQRMCRATGVASAANCLMGSATTGGNSLSGKSDPELGAATNYSLSPMYRVTARVTGPKNTISYIQAYVY